jgi:RNA polymerase sigma-70 factor, ECF subfamily
LRGDGEKIGAALARLAAGDAAAFEEIVRRHQGMVYSLAYHFLGDASAAEDAAQEVFLDLYRDAARLQSAAHLEFWLRRVTAHRSIDQARRNRLPTVSLEDGPEPAQTRQDPDPWLSARLRRLVAALPARRRMVVLLRFQEDLELHEIAEIMEMPINTVKSYLQRSLALLREKLARCRKDVTV